MAVLSGVQTVINVSKAALDIRHDRTCKGKNDKNDCTPIKLLVMNYGIARTQ